MFRQLREDAREFPATMTLSALWVFVFALMVVNQIQITQGTAPGQLLLGLRGGHRFGDLRLQELFAGELWRAVTATFVHYGLLHIGMNLYAFYHLGCLVESWYGAGPFLAIYVLTGGGGNLLSGLVRHALAWNPTIASGGGSVVVMGLVGLCAVVGWRSRTRLGDYLRNQMVWVLVLTAAIGLLLPLFGLPIIDNWGHACGAAVGALIGLANRGLSCQLGKPAAWWAGLLGGLVIAGSAVAQVADNQVEDRGLERLLETSAQRAIENERRIIRLDQVRDLYIRMAGPRRILIGARAPILPRGGPTGAGVGLDPDEVLYRAVLSASLVAMDSMSDALAQGPTGEDYRRTRQLLAEGVADPPTPGELREFNERILRVRETLRLEIERQRTLGFSALIRSRLD